MATIITTLKTHTNQDTVYPNIREENIPDDSISVTKIRDGSITKAKIANGAVGYNQIEDGAIFGDKILDESISGSKLAEDSVGISPFSTDRVSIYDLIERYGSEDFLISYAPILVYTQFGRLCAEWDAGSYTVYASIDSIYVLQGQFMSLKYHDPIASADVTIDYTKNQPTPDSLKRVYVYFIAGAI